MIKYHYGYNATTGHMRPIAHAGELAPDEVLKVSYLHHACEPGGDEVLRVVPKGWPSIEQIDRAICAWFDAVYKPGYSEDEDFRRRMRNALLAALPKPGEAQ